DRPAGSRPHPVRVRPPDARRRGRGMSERKLNQRAVTAAMAAAREAPGYPEEDRESCEEIIEAYLAALGFRDLVDIARSMLDEHYPVDLFGRGGMFEGDPGARFTQHLRDALAVVDAVWVATPGKER